MVFQPGQSENPGGRAKKVRKKVVIEVNAVGGIGELELLAAVVAHPDAPLTTRIGAGCWFRARARTLRPTPSLRLLLKPEET